jgi:hypothetical protein
MSPSGSSAFDAEAGGQFCGGAIERWATHPIVSDVRIADFSVRSGSTHVVLAALSGFANGVVGRTSGSKARRMLRAIARSHPVP